MYLARRMEYCDLAGHIQVTPSAYGLLRGRDKFGPRARVEKQGIGELETIRLLNRVPVKEGRGGKGP